VVFFFFTGSGFFGGILAMSVGFSNLQNVY
jgi:hypothetical protein